MNLLFAIVLLAITSAVDGSSPSIRARETKLVLTEKASERDECMAFTDNPSGNAEVSQQMLAAFKPCGHYRSVGCQEEVIPPNVCFSGEGDDDLEFKPYIVQFDIGVHPVIRDTVVSYHDGPNGQSVDGDDVEPTIGPMDGERCLEIIVTGGSDATGGCAGKCGPGCRGAGFAKDCMKHDVCTTYKALDLERSSLLENFDDYDDGFCRDVDCGDEAAQSLMNCFIDRFFNDKSVRCTEELFRDEPNAYGFWSLGTKLFFEGPCNHFQNWESGQGIPNEDEIRNPYDFLAYLQSKGFDMDHEDMKALQS